MLYTLLCYNKEDVVWSWSKAEDEAVMSRLNVVHEKLVQEGKLGPALRLLPTTTATTLRAPDMVIDGPFAETKEQLLGFYVIDVPDLEAALDVARQLSAAKTPDMSIGSILVRCNRSVLAAGHRDREGCAEMALAHTIESKVAAAYRRGILSEKHR